MTDDTDRCIIEQVQKGDRNAYAAIIDKYNALIYNLAFRLTGSRADADDLEVTLYDNRTFKATVIGTDPTTDLALIRIKAKDLPILPLVNNSDDIKIGEWVWRWYPPAGREKLGHGWMGPYLITKQYGPVTYEIQLEKTSKPKVVHSDHLKRYEAVETPESWLVPAEDPQSEEYPTSEEEEPSDDEELNASGVDAREEPEGIPAPIDTGQDEGGRPRRNRQPPQRYGWE